MADYGAIRQKKVEMEILCKWTVILFERLKRKKWSTSEGRPFVLGNFPFEYWLHFNWFNRKIWLTSYKGRHIYLLNVWVFRLLIADNGNYLKLTKSHATDACK